MRRPSTAPVACSSPTVERAGRCRCRARGRVAVGRLAIYILLYSSIVLCTGNYRLSRRLMWGRCHVPVDAVPVRFCLSGWDKDARDSDKRRPRPRSLAPPGIVAQSTHASGLTGSCASSARLAFAFSIASAEAKTDAASFAPRRRSAKSAKSARDVVSTCATVDAPANYVRRVMRGMP